MDARVKNLWIERVALENQYYLGLKKILHKVFGSQTLSNLVAEEDSETQAQSNQSDLKETLSQSGLGGASELPEFDS